MPEHRPPAHGATAPTEDEAAAEHTPAEQVRLALERDAEIQRLAAELAETNRGVLALYAELDDRAAELRRAAREWETTFDSIMDGILLLDRDDAVLRANHSAARLLGRARDALIGRRIDDLLARGGAVHASPLSPARPGSPDEGHEARRRTEIPVDDRWLSVSIDPVGTEAASGARAVCVLTDVTARRRHEEERQALVGDAQAAQAAAERASKAKSDFLAVMSHELRTPLNAIAGYVDLLLMGLRGPLRREQERDLERVRRSQRHLLGLINDILNFAKVESGELRFDMRDVDVGSALRAAGELVEPQVRDRGIRYACAPSDRHLRARADPDKLQQILLNLLSNAVKFTPSGGTIELGCTADPDRVSIRVADSGQGIPADKLTAVFEPFVQVDRQSLDSSQKGVGLGLAISRDLARGMGGDLTGESELGRGSVFTVVLPRAPDAQDPAPTPDATPQPERGGADAGAATAPGRSP